LSASQYPSSARPPRRADHRGYFTPSFASYTPEEIVASARHTADKENIAISEKASPLFGPEAARLRSLPTVSGTALDVAGICAQGCYRTTESFPPNG
jgi:hypothetical protein